jgi:2-dehydro-3-deoxy-D-arabinonate dehydratase
MKIYKTNEKIIVEHKGSFFTASSKDWNSFVNRPDLYKQIVKELEGLEPDGSLESTVQSNILAPIGNQEVWASGVTYMRSREARMEESKDAGGGDFYARVYEADRPELFFKSPSYRVVGPGANVRIRKDSQWNVPEPELTLFICSAGTIEGYTIGNDMSSRDIEGENPLYLPQAKSYDGAAALGPCLYVPENRIDPEAMIKIEILRGGKTVFSGDVSINRMKRKHDELTEYLFRETTFPYGAFLMTGTGIVPPDSFTLNEGDVIQITIDAIGTLSNTVAL